MKTRLLTTLLTGFALFAFDSTVNAQKSSSRNENKPIAPGAVRCRVVITGFSVKQATIDDALRRDGAGDEVYLDVAVTQVPRSGEPFTNNRTSQTMGDVDGYRGRIQAGSETNHGGLKSDDVFPTNPPYNIIEEVKGNRLPMLVFDGVIEQGETVLLFPMIIEWDIGVDALKTIRDLIPKKAVQAALVAADPGLAAVPVENIFATFGKSGSRPIGVEDADGDKYKYQPRVIKLTPESVKRLVKLDAGLGPGISETTYQDSGRAGEGRYQLFVKIETY